MIATHNMKVNGRWVAAGEEYEPVAVSEEKPAEVKAETKEAKAETPKEEPKPKAARKRKAGE